MRKGFKVTITTELWWSDADVPEDSTVDKEFPWLNASMSVTDIKDIVENTWPRTWELLIDADVQGEFVVDELNS